MIPILGLIIGILIGIFLPYRIPDAYTMYIAVGILAALDSVFGGAVASLQGRFELRIFLSGFFGNMLLAVLEKRVGFKLMQKDVYLNIAGGLRVSDPAIDLSVIAAIISIRLLVVLT